MRKELNDEEDVTDAPRRKRGRFKKKVIQAPLTREESDRLVAEYVARGGKVNRVEPASMAPTLRFKHTSSSDKSVDAQMPGLGDAVVAANFEDMEMLG